jgi:adenylate kinase family enzyme
MRRLHILGASGSGTTTLGKAIANELAAPHFDTDDYYWLPTSSSPKPRRPTPQPASPNPVIPT